MSIIGVVADDLTGATTVGVLLARSGVKTAALFSIDSLNSDCLSPDYKAIVVSTDSRPLPSEEAMQRVGAATAALKKSGAEQFSKRTDTTLRGGIGAEIDAMLDELGPDTVAVMVPAMPQSNRIVVGGYSVINSVPLSKTPVANDVRTPVRDSYVPRLIAGQTNRKVGHISLDALLQGLECLEKSLQESRDSGAEIIIVDATSMEEVEMIAQSVVELKWKVLAVDPGPFTERIAMVKGWASDGMGNVLKLREKHEEHGTVLVVAGSASPVTAAQMAALKEVPGTVGVPVKIVNLIDGKEASVNEIKAVSSQVMELLAGENPPKVVVIQRATDNDQVLNFDEEEKRLGLKHGQAADNINLGFGKIIEEILEHQAEKVKGLYMTGGDVMVNVCKALGAEGIRLIDYVIPQADFGKLIGSRYDGLPVIGKGGLTGDTKTAIKCVERLLNENE